VVTHRSVVRPWEKPNTFVGILIPVLSSEDNHDDTVHWHGRHSEYIVLVLGTASLVSSREADRLQKKVR